MNGKKIEEALSRLRLVKGDAAHVMGTALVDSDPGSVAIAVRYARRYRAAHRGINVLRSRREIYGNDRS